MQARKFGVNVNTWLIVASVVLAALEGVFGLPCVYAFQHRLPIMVQVALVLAIVMAAAFSATLLYVVRLRAEVKEKREDMPLVAAAAHLGLLAPDGDEETQD